MTLIALYISKNFRTGGQKRYLELLSGLATRNHTVHFYHRRERNFPMQLHPNLILHPLDVPEGRSQQKAFTKALKSQKKEDLLSLNAHKILLFGDSSLLCGIHLKKLLNIPLIIALRNNIVIADKIARKKSLRNIPIDMRNLYRERQMGRYADRLIFQTTYDRDSVCSRNGFPLDKAAVIPNSIRAGWFLPEWRGANRSVRLRHLIFIGSDHKRKGLDLLLRALETLEGQGKDFYLTLVGDFPRTNPDVLPDWVHLKGRLSSPLEALSRSDLLVVPSLYDSFPNTVLESLYVGTPAIGADVAGIKAMLKEDSLLFPVNDVSGMVKTLEPLFDSESYKKVKEICRNRLKMFDFDWIAPWEEILENI